MIPKFRAWHKELKAMCRVLSIAFDGEFAKSAIVFGQNNILPVGNDEVVFLQSTGLHDKNDMEICEGDVVEINLSSLIDGATKKQLCSVIFSDGSFILKPLSKIELPWFADSRISMHKEVKVIGNIHENPELLENKK